MPSIKKNRFKALAALALLALGQGAVAQTDPLQVRNWAAARTSSRSIPAYQPTIWPLS